MRINRDSLVGLPDAWRRSYNASKSFEAVYKFAHWSQEQNLQSLFVKGIIIDTIGKTTKHSAVSGDIPDEWPGFAGWDDLSQPPPRSFWMTLVAGRGPDGQNPPPYYSRACQHAFETQKVQGASLDVRYLIDDPAFNTITVSIPHPISYSMRLRY
jgi:hypothetical protein